MATLRPIGEYKGGASSNASRKLARRTAHVLVFLVSLTVGYLLCGQVLRGYEKNLSLIDAEGAGGKRGRGSGATGQGSGNRKNKGEGGRASSSGASAGAGDSSSSSAARHAIHTLTTTNGSPYQNYQMRIAYASYQRMLELPGGEHHVAFTRILHRTDRDKDVLAEEIPTFRADPLQPACDDWCPYPVSDRANAVAQFWAYAEEHEVMKGIDWVYMIESDYIFVKPLLPPTIELDRRKGYGFHFHYIQPEFHTREMGKLYEGSPGDVQATGPAPLMMSVENWMKTTPIWEELTARIEADEEMKETLGWVREMYAFSTALRKAEVTVVLDEPQSSAPESSAPVQFIREIPLHDSLAGAHALHYTLPTIILRADATEEPVWKYDKREHTAPKEVLRVKKVDTLPAWPGEGQWKFIEGAPVTKPLYDMLVMMVSGFNAAIGDLKELHA